MQAQTEAEHTYTAKEHHKTPKEHGHTPKENHKTPKEHSHTPKENHKTPKEHSLAAEEPCRTEAPLLAYRSFAQWAEEQHAKRQETGIMAAEPQS
jgi:hypothetical protein